MSLGPLEDAEGEFSHQCLTVSRALASDYKICVLRQVVEMDGIQQKVDARATVGIHVLQESIAQAASCACTRHVLTVASQMLG